MNKQTGEAKNYKAAINLRIIFRSEPWKVKKNMLGYYKLCRHYKFALDSIFELYPESHGVIIVEGKLPSYSKSIYVGNILGNM